MKTEGLDEERFELIKKSYYGSQIREYNNVEAVATTLINSYMSDTTPFDIIETVANVTFKNVQDRLFKQLDSNCVTISVIEPIE